MHKLYIYLRNVIVHMERMTRRAGMLQHLSLNLS